MWRVPFCNTQIWIKKGDITKEKADVIVNAANTSLLGGGGVDGAIHRVGGAEITEDCQKIRSRQGGCRVGEAVITRAGALQAKYVVHTVGPVWNGGKKGEQDLLFSAYWNALKLAMECQAKSIAFPAISTGIYRFPQELAAEIAIKSVLKFVQEHEDHLLEEIYFILFDEMNYQIYWKNLSSVGLSKL